MRVFDKVIKGAKVAVIVGQPSIEDESRGILLSAKMDSIVTNALNGRGIVYFSKYSCGYKRRFEYKKIGNVWKYLPLPHEELMRQKDDIAKRLSGKDYNLVVAIGETALRVLTPFEGIDKYRGSVLESDIVDIKILPIYEPNSAIRDPNIKPFFDWDAQKAAIHQGTKDFLRKDLKIHITQDLDQIENIFNDEFLNDPNSKLSFDIETSGYELSALGLAKTQTEAYVMPFYHILSNKLPQALKLVDRILRSPVRKIAQNGNFDITFLGLYYGIRVDNFWFDTMLAQHSMFPQLPKGLDTLASIYTNEPYWKDEGKSWKNQDRFSEADWQQFYEYNGKDAANTFEIAEAQAPLLKARGVESVFEREMRVCYPLIHSELKGMKVDRSKQKDLQEWNDIMIAKGELFLHHLVGGDPSFTTTEQFLKIIHAKRAKKTAKDPRNGYLNINSPKQMKEYLYGACKLPKRVKGGKPTVDNDALLSLQKFGFELISTVLFLRKYRKQDTFYSIKVDADGRVRTTFKPGGTETGRLSSSKSITGTGFNLQTIPKKARIFFVADDDYVLLAPDYEKAESWMVAYLAGDEDMLEALRGKDFHSTNASKILGKIVTKEDYAERQLGKKISHAANYRTTAFTLERELQKEGYIFDKKACQKMLDDYFRAYPRVRAYQEGIINELKVNGRTLVTPFGRKITYYDFWDDHLFNAACAYKPQSSVGDMTNEGLNRIYYNIRSSGVRVDIMLQVHDSLVMQIHKDDLSWDLVEKIVENMKVPVTIRGRTFTVPVEMTIGKNWLELTEIKSEQNLNEWLFSNGYKALPPTTKSS